MQKAPAFVVQNAPAFVVQKHDATRLHYDLRLELGGVLKSWAVTRGPSLDPAEKRLAVEVEDHPLEYGAFEGAIAAGYGAGTVMLWDRGTWAPLSADPAADLAAGHLRFTLRGERLRGAWHLVRMRPRGRAARRNWLLVKDEDAEARPGDADALLGAADRPVATGRGMEAIVGRGAPRRAARAGAKAAAQPGPPAGRAVVAGVALSHPERLYWPAEGITKRELAEYLVAAAPRLLPGIAGRPLSLLRAPEGIEGERFFQRHAGRGTAAAIAIAIARATPRGESAPLVQVDTVAGLVALAQSGTLEIHPWLARSAAATRPDRLVLDLDPGEDVDFARVAEAALALRGRLAAIGLRPFCKTTGGRGLHVVAPVRGASWKRLHDTAAALCEALVAEAPDRFTTDNAKAVRGGRIFLDHQRNARGASAVAAWSTRARPGATVSVPLHWAEVAPGLDPGAFTLRSVAARLAAPDPWEGLDAAAAPLPAQP